MRRHHAATERQILAASPQASTWLSANAGSGKTKVLTDRVARLLLAGTEPHKVLCLTYTKAAAAEMQNRLLKRLGAWAMLEDTALEAELSALGEEVHSDKESLARARRLFAQAIETPGGLKIQTIHAFCGDLLRRFPLEAGVPHGFSEMDDRSAARLREDLIEEIASGPGRPVLDALLQAISSEDIQGIVDDICQNRAAFPADVTEAELRKLLQLPETLTPDTLPDLVFIPGTKALVDTVVPLLTDKTQAAQNLKEALKSLDLDTPTPRDLHRLEEIFLLKDGVRVARLKQPQSILTKGARSNLGEDLSNELLELAERVCRAKDAEFALQALRKSVALHQFAQVLLPEFARRKAQAGWLDFEDLIERAGRLLSDPSVAQWVLFRLDGGIDHILVDEAQDTSPGQWRVIERLADEFTAGEGARHNPRTVFVVGDRKQSIYSFQGADLAHFEHVQSRFSARFSAVGKPLQNAALLHSFRSSSAILRLVDLVFQGEEAQRLGGAPEHLAFHELLPGRVDLWPLIPASPKPEAENWADPVDLPQDDSAPVILARTMAAEIRAMIDAGVQVPMGEGARPIHEGDFLVLLQRRSGLFYEIIRACKAEGLQVAGADRLRLGADMAVKDIVSVLAFLATPEDDLSLAGALRSPLFGWSEAELYRLAQPRKGYLWQALRSMEETPALDILRDLLEQVDFLRPYDLIERLLTRHAGRQRLIARLGIEAEEGIDELITQALAYERNEVPSLTGFLGWLGPDEVEIKRQSESEGRALRVMTVHGSKGLEAPIVILPDTGPSKTPQGADILIAPDSPAFAAGGAKTLPEPLVQWRDDALERLDAERMRLLYVALTRAEKWLILAASDAEALEKECWYAQVAQGMAKAGTVDAAGYSSQLRNLGEVARFSHGTWPADGRPVAAQTSAPPPQPEWMNERVVSAEKNRVIVSASDLGGAKALPGEGEGLSQEAALRRGRQIHLLLEHLPKSPRDIWPELAKRLLASNAHDVSLTETETVLQVSSQVVDAVTAAGYFEGTYLAEAEISAPLAELGGQRLHGIIDLLQILPDRIRVLDYKSNALIPPCAELVPLGLLRQMAAYRSALRQIYPGRAIESALLWTATGQIMALPDVLLDAALRSPTAS